MNLGLYTESRQPVVPLDRPSFTGIDQNFFILGMDSPMFLFPEIASRTSSPTISSPSASDCSSPTELGMLIFCI